MYIKQINKQVSNCLFQLLFYFRFNKRSKDQENSVLQQGITLPSPPLSTSEPLPLPNELPSSLTKGTKPDDHVFTLPPNTAGQSKVRRPVILPKPSTQPSSPSYVMVIQPSSSSQTHTLTAASSSHQASSSSSIPASTTSYRKRRQERELAGEHVKKYKERSGPSKCSKCGEDRTGGHKQYYGNWFCPNTSKQSEEEWRTSLAAKGYKKKNQQ